VDSPNGNDGRHAAKAFREALRIAVVAAADPFVPSVTRGKGAICEARIAYEGLIHPSWEEVEPNLVVAFVALSVTKPSAKVTVKVQHAFSFHSLARFYERSGARDDRDVIAAMASALVFDPAECRLGEEVPVGNWRGIVKQREKGSDTVQMWCARTWLN
jgi:hypothetical protein